MRAVIQIQGSQHLVSEGTELLVNHLSTSTPTLNIDQVLLYTDNKDFSIGKPYLANCLVEAEVLGEEKGDKIRVSKYKAKSRYRRTVGFRSKFNRIRIKKIVLK